MRPDFANFFRAGTLQKRLITFLTGSRLRRNLSTVAVGQIAAQLVVLAATPVLTRLYSPVDFALLTVFAGTLNLLLCVSTWRFEWSVPIARRESLAAGCITLGLLATVVVTVTGLGLYALGVQLPGEFTALSDERWLVVPLALAVTFGGIDALVQGWFTRSGDIRILAVARFFQAITNVLVGIFLWFLLGEGQGLIWALLAGSVVSLLVGLSHARGLSSSLAAINASTLAAAMRHFRSAATLSVASSIAQSVSTSLLPILLLFYHTPTEVGWFALANRLAIGPLGFVTQAVSQSFWAEAAQMIHDNPLQLRALYLKITRWLLLLALPLAALCTLGPLFVGPLLGRENWTGAGWVLAAMAPLVVGWVVATPLNHLLAHGRASWVLGWDVGRAIAIITTVAATAHCGLSFVVTILSMSLVALVCYGALIWLHLYSYANPARSHEPT